MSRYTLEEQERLDEAKAFWARYGNGILIVLILVFGAFALKNGWSWWQSRKAAEAVKGFESLQQAIEKNDMPLIKKVSESLEKEQSGSPYAARAALLAAKAAWTAGDKEFATAQLKWAVEHVSLVEYAATARLLLSGLLLDAEKYDEALALVNKTEGFPGFAPLFLDRQGDIALAKKDYAAARQGYEASLKQMDDKDGVNPWKQVVQRKLLALPESGENKS